MRAAKKNDILLGVRGAILGLRNVLENISHAGLSSMTVPSQSAVFITRSPVINHDFHLVLIQLIRRHSFSKPCIKRRETLLFFKKNVQLLSKDPPFNCPWEGLIDKGLQFLKVLRLIMQ